MLMTISKDQDARIDTLEHSIKTRFKGVRAHLEDLEQWKKGMETKVANIAASIPRQQGRLPGQADENPKGHQIAVITLRSGKELMDVEPRNKGEEIAQ